jgi:protein SCO1/2
VKSRSRARSRLIAACLVTALAAGTAACGSDEAEHTLVGYRPSGVQQVDTVEIPDVSAAGEPFTFRAEPGQLLLVSFGYTQCPDVCPTTLTELAEVKKLLGKDGDRLQALFVTVDPERDTPELLTAYMANFDPSFLALRPTPAELPAVAKDFKIYYKKVPGVSATSYTMDHSAGSYVFDAQGQLRLFTRYGSGAPALAADIALLLR